jgi:hypothetical protein
MEERFAMLEAKMERVEEILRLAHPHLMLPPIPVPVPVPLPAPASTHDEESA